MFHDTMLNKLRIVSAGTADGSLPINKPLAINSASNYGGKLHCCKDKTFFVCYEICIEK